MRKYGELRNIWDYLGGASGKDPPANAGDASDKFDPWVGKIPLEEGMATPVFLPGESHGQRSLASCSP